jgi:hypothetical protein
MLTFFTTAKPFQGHDGVIQRNALKSWKLLHPDVEVILFGDEEGAAEVCAELDIRHEPYVERFESKYPYVNFMFARAQEIAKHEFLCYSNCDIVFLTDFSRVFEKTIVWRKRFVFVAQRWDTDVTQPIDFKHHDWAKHLQELATTQGIQQISDYIDFFVFRKGIYDQVPPLVVGYAYWDHWMMWKALSANAPVLDASLYLVPVHQNHGYRTTPERTKGSQTDRIAMRNFELSGKGKQLKAMLDANYVISRYGQIYWNPFRRRLAEPSMMKLRQKTINFTFRFRKLLGLRRANLDKWFGADDPR